MEILNRTIRQCTDKLSASNLTFSDLFDVISMHGERLMIERDEGYNKAAYTYNDVISFIRQAAYTIDKKGIKDEFIGLYGKADLEWVVSFWAILMSGNKPYLINSNLTDRSLSLQMQTLGVKYVLTDKPTDRFSAETIIYSDLLGEEKLYNSVFGNQLALSTSGTSLSEKLCLYTGEELCHQILNTQYIVNHTKSLKKHYKGHLKILMFLPYYHIFGLIASFLWFAFFGRSFVVLADYSSATIMRTIKKYDVTHVIAVPLLWHTIENSVMKEVRERGEEFEQKFNKGIELSIKLQSVFPRLGKKIARRMFKEVNEKLFGDSVGYCISGGSHINPSALKLINALGYELHNGYGMSETGITSLEMSPRIKDRLTPSIGKPLPTCEYIVKEDGELYVQGKTVCKNLIVDGKKVTVDKSFATGDVVKVLPSGGYAIVGRKSELVIGDSGENISPDVVEKEFSVEKIKNLCVLGDKDMKSLIMVVQLPENAFSVSVLRVHDEIERINAKISSSERVKKIYYTYDPIMEQNAIKVSRALLRRKIDGGEVRLYSIDEIADRNMTGEQIDSEIGRILSDIISSSIGVDKSEITPDANFFTDLNCTSLDYFNIIAAVNEKFSIDIKFDEEHLAYTLREMEKTVREYYK